VVVVVVDMEGILLMLQEHRAALASSFSNIQNQFHQLQMPQTLGCLDLLALGQHQQEHRMLIT
jgi:hypothetical protein